jgi:hypothetical protein
LVHSIDELIQKIEADSNDNSDDIKSLKGKIKELKKLKSDINIPEYEQKLIKLERNNLVNLIDSSFNAIKDSIENNLQKAKDDSKIKAFNKAP